MRGTYKQGNTQFLSKFGAGDRVLHGSKVLFLERVFFHPGKDGQPPYFTYAGKGTDGVFIKVREDNLARVPVPEKGTPSAVSRIVEAKKAKLKEKRTWWHAIPVLLILSLYLGALGLLISSTL